MKGLNYLISRLIKQTSYKVHRLAQCRMKQIIHEGDQQVERIAPKIICGTIEDVYKTPFRLLGTFGRNKLSHIKKNLQEIMFKQKICQYC